MQQMLNLKHVSFKAALTTAYDMSGMTKGQISSASDLPLNCVERYLKRNDAYSPQPENIPALCRAMKSTLPVDWLVTQIEDIYQHLPIVGASDLADAAMSIADHVGQFCAATREHVADGKVEKREACESQARIAEMIRHLKKLHDALEPLCNGKIIDNGRD